MRRQYILHPQVSPNSSFEKPSSIASVLQGDMSHNGTIQRNKACRANHQPGECTPYLFATFSSSSHSFLKQHVIVLDLTSLFRNTVLEPTHPSLPIELTQESSVEPSPMLSASDFPALPSFHCNDTNSQEYQQNIWWKSRHDVAFHIRFPAPGYHYAHVLLQTFSRSKSTRKKNIQVHNLSPPVSTRR